MGTCESKDGKDMGPRPEGGFWDKDSCFAAGGAKFKNAGAEMINPAFSATTASAGTSQCGAISTCVGTNVPNTAIGGKVCGKGNIEFVCAGTAAGPEWKDSGLPCDRGAEGSCPTSCGPMTTCGGATIPKSKIGAKECGDKNLTYVCGPDGSWVVGGTEGTETCQCMTICPELRVCDGTLLSKAPIGKEVCSIDRKMRTCVGNMLAPPEWSYGKKCACPDDPPEVVPTLKVQAVVDEKVGEEKVVGDNTLLIAGVAFILLFIMIMVVVLVFAMRRKRGAFKSADVVNPVY